MAGKGGRMKTYLQYGYYEMARTMGRKGEEGKRRRLS
jgi:hypothetical protein